jgi:hypothetical protein
MWEITTAYITGGLPGALLLSAWFGSCIMFVVRMNAITMRSKHTSTTTTTSDMNMISTSRIAYVKFGLMFLLNVCVVGMLNGVYVYLTMLELDVWIHTCIQICFAFIKYLCNFVVVPATIFSSLPISPYRSWFKLFVNMLNSVFIPCIASSFTSTSCFQVK